MLLLATGIRSDECMCASSGVAELHTVLPVMQ
jgi:hypothetical protein